MQDRNPSLAPAAGEALDKPLGGGFMEKTRPAGDAGMIDIKARADKGFGYLRGNPLIASLALAILVSAAIGNAVDAYDGDMWWILATGREVVENGVPSVNPFCAEGGAIVVQQWLHDAVVYGAYCIAGALGIQLLVLCLSLLVSFQTYRVAVAFGGFEGRCKAMPLLIAALAFAVMSFYISARPHAWSMLVFMEVLLVVRRYLVCRDGRVLAVLPLLVALHSNLHASMLMYDFFIVAVMAVPAVVAERRDGGCVRHLATSLLLAVVAMAAASCANPYGALAPGYLFLSYGAASYGDAIREMAAVSIATAEGAVFVYLSLVPALACMFRRARSPLSPLELSLAILFLVSDVLFGQHVRNIWFLALFAVPFASAMLSDCDMVPSGDAAPAVLRVVESSVLSVALLLGAAGASAVSCAMSLAPFGSEPQVLAGEGDTLPEAEASFLLALGERAYGSDGALPLLNDFNEGGYLEWRGLSVFIDARPEVWEPLLSGVDEHRYRDYIDSYFGDAAASARCLDGCDAALVNGGSQLSVYLAASESWLQVEVPGAAEGYTVWVRDGSPAAELAGEVL